ncbi:hypothetical protein LTR10_011982 [Elasticomyces elasticus]|nr:hypothetical protein LTR10_011982 [Elasticomyces elasticus]KAK4968924.1 hypothetical protein LTR42_009203 [Elasticomyces elasticus]
MYSGTSRPVPSNAALKALRQLAYISSGTAIGVATLCAEERRRRTQTVQKIADNARRIRQSPRYYQNAAVATQTPEDDIIGSGGLGWLPEYSERQETSEGTAGKPKHEQCGPPFRGHELPSTVQRGYAQLEEQSKKHKESIAKRRKVPTNVQQRRVQPHWQPFRPPQSQIPLRTDLAGTQSRGAPRSKVDFSRPGYAGPQLSNETTGTPMKSPPGLPKLVSHEVVEDNAPMQQPPKVKRPVRHSSSEGGADAEVQVTAINRPLRNGRGKQKQSLPSALRRSDAILELEALRTKCRRLLSTSRVEVTPHEIATHRELSANTDQWRSLVYECFDAASTAGDIRSMHRLLQLADVLVPGPDNLPYCASFLRFCDAQEAYDEVLDLFSHGKVLPHTSLRDLDGQSKEIIAYACTRSSKSHALTVGHFQYVFDHVPVALRGRILQQWTPVQLLAEWRATRHMATFNDRIKKLRRLFGATGEAEALFRLEKTVIDVLLSANAHEQARNSVADLHRNTSHDSFTVSAAAVLFAKKGQWDSLNRLLAVAGKLDKTACDANVTRRLNNTLHLYAREHKSVDAWKFVTAMVDSLGFQPNQATTEIMLQCFVSKNTIGLIPKWIRHIRIMGERFTLDARLAAKLLTRYYLDYRPSHVLVMWFCRNLAHFAPSLAGPEYFDLVREAVGFDIRKLEGQHNKNISSRRSKVETRLNSLDSEHHNVVPSPGWTWDNQVHFTHPNAITKVPANGYGSPSVSASPEEELPSMIQIEDFRPLPHEMVPTTDAVPNILKSDKTPSAKDPDSVNAPAKSFEKPERAMVKALSVHDHNLVLQLYHQSLNREGLPSSPFALEVAVEACLRQDRGDAMQANGLLREARKAGMNITGAMGPMLVHRMKRLKKGDRAELDKLHETVTEYYRINDENGWPVKHHVGVTAANILIHNQRGQQGIAVLNAIFPSDHAARRPLDTVAMAVFIDGYFTIGSGGGLRWAFETVLEQNMRIDQNFLHAVKAIVRRHGFDGTARWAVAGDKSMKTPIVHWIQQCYERRASQMLEAKVLGRRLVACLAKCAKEQEKPTVNVAMRGDVEDVLFGQRMRTNLPEPSIDAAEDVAAADLTRMEHRRRLRHSVHIKEKVSQITRSRLPLRTNGRRASPLRRHHIRWLRQYRAYLRHDLTMPDGKVASFRYKLADSPQDSLASRRRNAATQGRGGLTIPSTVLSFDEHLADGIGPDDSGGASPSLVALEQASKLYEVQ